MYLIFNVLDDNNYAFGDVMQAVKNEIKMFCYETETAESKNDLKRLQTYGKYQLAHNFNSISAQSITALVNKVSQPKSFA